MEKENEKSPGEILEERGKVYPPTGPVDREKDFNPLKDLSCDEVLHYMKDFCDAKLGGNELLLKKIERHLKNSVIGRKCGCAQKFSEQYEKNSARK